jgi:antitoxin component of RelBE/YafQ-DinJ toxin-antitoxin module
LTQVELHSGLPFPVSMPNQETIKAMRDANSGTGLKAYRSFRELRGSRMTKTPLRTVRR